MGRRVTESAESQRPRVGGKVTKEDAQDLLDFVEAICEYAFVLTAKFDNYMARRKKPNGNSPPDVGS